MRKSVFYRLKTLTQGRLPSADASSLSISYKVVGHVIVRLEVREAKNHENFFWLFCSAWLKDNLRKKISKFTDLHMFQFVFKSGYNNPLMLMLVMQLDSHTLFSQLTPIYLCILSDLLPVNEHSLIRLHPLSSPWL